MRKRRLEGPTPALESLAQADQFEERPVELDDMIFGAPGMAIARPDLKAEPPVERCLRGEIEGGYHDMIDGAGHLRSCSAAGVVADRSSLSDGDCRVSPISPMA